MISLTKGACRCDPNFLIIHIPRVTRGSGHDIITYYIHKQKKALSQSKECSSTCDTYTEIEYFIFKDRYKHRFGT